LVGGGGEGAHGIDLDPYLDVELISILKFFVGMEEHIMVGRLSVICLSGERCISDACCCISGVRDGGIVRWMAICRARVE
jgi:hypothetical protein